MSTSRMHDGEHWRGDLSIFGRHFWVREDVVSLLAIFLMNFVFGLGLGIAFF